jgi:hypothetical protein
MKGESKTLFVRYGGREQCEYKNNFQTFKRTVLRRKVRIQNVVISPTLFRRRKIKM